LFIKSFSTPTVLYFAASLQWDRKQNFSNNYWSKKSVAAFFFMTLWRYKKNLHDKKKQTILNVAR